MSYFFKLKILIILNNFESNEKKKLPSNLDQSSFVIQDICDVLRVENRRKLNFKHFVPG